MGTQFETLSDRLSASISFEVGMSDADLIAWVNRQTERPPLQFQMHSGSFKILSAFAQEMPDRGFVMSFTDVTAERQSAQALHEAKALLEQRVASRTVELADALNEAERANASKSRFVAAASHDLLQPLSAAKLYVANLGSGLSENDTQIVAAKTESALSSVEQILEALLDISKLDSGNATAHVSAVSLKDLFSQLDDAFRPVAQSKGLELRFVPAELLVKSDASYLQRILQNLLSNAIRYTDSGKVLVGVRRRKNFVVIEVWDTGIGIADDQTDIVFHEFQRLNADASATEGMGLGLAIVERACGLLQHPIRLKSELGKGTVFSVEVPLEQVQSPANEKPVELEGGNSGQLVNTIVLLIENDADLRNALTMTMEAWGVHVLECASEHQAIDLLREIEISPDVIIADYQLDNEKSGIDAVRNVNVEFGTVPACIISANRSPYVIETCNMNGLTLIHKPIDAQRLKQLLRALPT
jgi:hypothetical protein